MPSPISSCALGLCFTFAIISVDLTVLKQLEANIRKNGLFDKEHRLLLAFSGGIDSVVLAHLLHSMGYSCSLAHCNFRLRGSEAQGDKAFCENFAKDLGLPVFTKDFDTKAYAAERKLSTQMAARELRYTWFKELMTEHGFDRLLTAHHANDNVETLLVNLVRGTGIKGLQGIPERQDYLVRPLLFATKEEIMAYGNNHQLPYRNDSSNAEVKYKRNFIRHKVIPELKSLNPALEETIHTSVQFFKQSAEIVQAYAREKYTAMCHEADKQLFIDIQALSKEPYPETLLFEWLHQRHFKPRQIAQLCEVIHSEKHSGKQFSSPTHRLVVDRKYIIVQPFEREPLRGTYTINTPDDTRHLPIALSMEAVNEAIFSGNRNEIVIPYTDQLFPLTLRRWKQGDKFRPFGMTGFKKLSDFFKDQKLSLFEKEAVWILANKEQIIWIIGYRMDDRCRIGAQEQALLKMRVG